MKKLLTFSLALISAAFVANSAFAHEYIQQEYINVVPGFSEYNNDMVEVTNYISGKNNDAFTAEYRILNLTEHVLGGALSNTHLSPEFIKFYKKLYHYIKTHVQESNYATNPVVKGWNNAHAENGFSAAPGQLAVNPAFLE